MDHTRLPRRLVKLRIKLQLPDKICIHNVFHVSCVKKMLGQHQTVQTILPMLDDEGRIIGNQRKSLQPEKENFILEHSRNISLGGRIFQMKMHHERQNNFVNNTCPYPFFEDKEF